MTLFLAFVSLRLVLLFVFGCKGSSAAAAGLLLLLVHRFTSPALLLEGYWAHLSELLT